MYKFQNHIDVLEAILKLRDTLPKHEFSSVGQMEVMSQLATMYACLDASELRHIVSDFKGMNRRANRRVPIKKSA